MAELKIEGTVFCVAGILSDYGSHGQAEQAIKDAGGKITRSIGAKTQVLVLGSNTWTQEEKARSRGIHIIKERDLAKLLAGQTLHVKEDTLPEGSAEMNELIGEARSILDGHPSGVMWSRITALVDSCAPDRLSELVDYLEPHINRWTFSYAAQWRVSQHTHACKGMPSRWNQFMPFGELRIAPYQWTVAMAAGDDSPKYRLVHGVHTRDMELNGTMLAKILTCPSLTNLRVFNVDENKVSKTLFKKLRTCDSTRSLEHLRLSRMDPKTIGGIDGDHHLENLRELTVYTEFATKDEALHALMASRAVEHVQVFNFGVYASKALSGFTSHEIMPSLQTITMTYDDSDHIREVITHPIVERVGHVRVSPRWSVIQDPEAFARLMRDGHELVNLDLSRLGMRVSVDVQVDDAHLDQLYATLGAWQPPARLTTLTLGRWFDEARAKALVDQIGVSVVRGAV